MRNWLQSFLNICNIYILLWMLYFLQGTLYQSGSIISQAILAIIIAIGLFCVFKVVTAYNCPKFLIILLIFYLLLVVYGIELLISGRDLYIHELQMSKVPNHQYLKDIMISFPNLYAFYYFSRKKILTENLLKKWVPVFLVVGIICFLRFQYEAISMLDYERDSLEITNNYCYFFLSMIPLIMLFRNLKAQYFILLLCVAFIILGMKRGAILAGGIVFIFFLLSTIRNTSRKNRFLSIILPLLAFALIFFLVRYLLDSSEYFLARLDKTLEGDSSNRDEYYSFFFSHYFSQSSSIALLFGNGANATLAIGENYAHNDWLEILINQGALGFMMYLVCWISFFKTWRKKRHDPRAFVAIGMCFLIIFIKTVFSMSYTDVNMFLASVLGLYLYNGAEKKSVPHENTL